MTSREPCVFFFFVSPSYSLDSLLSPLPRNPVQHQPTLFLCVTSSLPCRRAITPTLDVESEMGIGRGGQEDAEAGLCVPLCACVVVVSMCG